MTATIDQQPTACSVVSVAGDPFGLTINLSSLISLDDITDPVVTVTNQNNIPIPQFVPTITNPIEGQWFLSWSATQTQTMFNYGALPWSLSATVEGVGPYALLGGTLRMLPPTTPGPSGPTSVDLEVNVGTVTIDLEVTSSGGGGIYAVTSPDTSIIVGGSAIYPTLEVNQAIIATLASPVFTGSPQAPTKSPLTDNTDLATTAYTDAAVLVETDRAEGVEATKAPLASPALTGVPTAPTASALTDDTQIATTAYADSAVAVETSRAEAAEALKAPLASPALTGNPTAPTQTTGDNSTKIATDAFVSTAVATETSRAETAEALLAPKASPALTGTPTAPTASPLTDDTQLATTAYTDAAVATETSHAEAAELVLTTAVDNGFNPAVTDVGGAVSYSLPNAQWAIYEGNAYYLDGGSVPDGYTPAAIGPDGFLYPMESTAPPFDIAGAAATALVGAESFAVAAANAAQVAAEAASDPLGSASTAQTNAESFATAAVAAAVATIDVAIDQGFNPTVTAVGGCPLVTLPSPQWAFDGSGNGYWLDGGSLPSGYTAAVLGPDIILYPIGVPA